MFDKNDKRRLYWLIDQFLIGNMTERAFCDEYYYSYSKELDYDTLTDFEKEAFSSLNTVVSRFSEFEEDHLALPGGFKTRDQLKQKIAETRTKLDSASN